MSEKEMMRQTIWLEKAIVATLKQIGEREDRSVGWLIRQAVQQFVQRQAPQVRTQTKTGRMFRPEQHTETSR